ncbi:MAG TPA: biopolymer transporter ExbD [Myxococcota bacterium]|nr:biopolymer transporter ExbD [Myxococcota bacterium]
MRRRDNTPGELNLVPIMNLVSILIPFLLVAAQFVNLAVVDTSLPGIQKDSDVPEPPERQLSVAITESQLMVLGANDVLGVEDTGGYAIPSEGQDLDTAELTRVLGLVKDEAPQIEDLVLVPDGSISYEQLIDVMDAARSESMDEGGRLLFPNQVIAGGT